MKTRNSHRKTAVFSADRYVFTTLRLSAVDFPRVCSCVWNCTVHGQRPKGEREQSPFACLLRHLRGLIKVPWPGVYYLIVTTCIIRVLNINLPIPLAARSEAWVCGRSLAGIAVSNPAGGMDVFFVSVVYSQVEVSASG